MDSNELESAMVRKGYVWNGTEWQRPVRIRTVRSGGNPRKVAKLEPDPGDGTLGERPVQKFAPSKVLVRLTSYRSRLLDEDNLCAKYHIDCCRYAGLIRQDDPSAAKIEVVQKKVGKGEPEFVRIEVFAFRSPVLKGKTLMQLLEEGKL